MKISVFDLKVVKVNSDAKDHYFICRNKPFTNIYIEVLAGKKIVVEDKSCITSLSKYFSNFEKFNYITGKPLMLNKKDLLETYVAINNKTRNIGDSDNQFGDKNYQMKEKYSADNLVVANLERVSGDVTEFGPLINVTEQKYIFEIISDKNETKYREIFTGFIAKDYEECVNLPYVVNPVPFTKYFPELEGKELPKLSLIWVLNDVNYLKGKSNTKELKRK